MAIKVQCPNPTCGKVFSVKTEYAGRKAKCPGCASPLIIPTPEGGGFDFGSLGGGPATAPASEPANPFAELEAVPSVPARSKSARAPAEAPRPASPPAAVAAPEPVAEVLPAPSAEVAALPIPEPVTPVATAEAFTDIAEAQSPDLPAGPEPWYYGFLAGYAKVLLWLGGILALLIALAAVGAAILMLSMDPKMGGGLIAAALAGAMGLLWAAMIFLGVLITVAFVLLCVDAARNLRDIRRQLRK